MSDTEIRRDDEAERQHREYLERTGYRMTCVNPLCEKLTSRMPAAEVEYVTLHEAEHGTTICGWCAKPMLSDFEMDEAKKKLDELLLTGLG
jgi:hypothetical protein